MVGVKEATFSMEQLPEVRDIGMRHWCLMSSIGPLVAAKRSCIATLDRWSKCLDMKVRCS